MSNREIEQGSDRVGDALTEFVTRWNDDARIGPMLAADCALLILDLSAGTVLHASTAALPLRSSIASTDGRLDPALGIEGQLRRAGLGAERPALARIQLDRRRLQPPVTCMVAQAGGADGTVIALIPTGRLPRLRPFVEAAAAPIATVASLPLSATPEPISDDAAALSDDKPPRFTWRSDGGDIIGAVSGPAGPVVHATMNGRSWQSLARSGVLTDAEGLLAAIAARRTFRAIPLVLRRPAPGPAFELELSGAPLARAGQPFAGYGGFGLLRPLAIEEIPPEEIPREEPATAAPEKSVDSHLSGDEHDAFREIARALGARFAGDSPEEATVPQAGTGADVMLFPTPASRAADPQEEPDGDPGEAAAVLDRLPAAILVCREGRPLFANRRLLALSGFADLAGMVAAGGLTRLFHGLSPDELTRSDAPVLLGTREGGSIAVTITRSTTEWDGAADLLLIREAETATVDAAIAPVNLDFALRRSAETAAILDSLEDAIVTVDAGGRILSLNRTAATLFDLDPREVVGAGIGSLFAPESAAEILRVVAAPVAGGSTRDAFVKGSGGAIALGVRILPLGEGAQGGVVLVVRQRHADPLVDVVPMPGRRAVEAVTALTSEVLAKISHEIRTPMTSVLGFTDAMLSEQFGPFENERYRECLNDIRASGEHVVNVVADLLDLASIEAGRRDLAFTDIPLNEIVSNCVVEMQPQAARDRIVIRTSFSDNLTRLVADERSVRQAALYVIANAIRFTEAGGQVIVSTTMADRGEIALRVRDTGSGMTPDEIASALEPYRNVAMPFPGAGTGLGLTITKALVEANRGRFRITSRKDEGTLVEMLFPTEQALSA